MSQNSGGIPVLCWSNNDIPHVLQTAQPIARSHGLDVAVHSTLQTYTRTATHSSTACAALTARQHDQT